MPHGCFESRVAAAVHGISCDHCLIEPKRRRRPLHAVVDTVDPIDRYAERWHRLYRAFLVNIALPADTSYS